jgi:hypothetical protein
VLKTVDMLPIPSQEEHLWEAGMQLYREYMKVFCVGTMLYFGCGGAFAQQDKNDVKKVPSTFNYQGKDYSGMCLVGVPPECGDFMDLVKPTDLIAMQLHYGLLVKQ